MNKDASVKLFNFRPFCCLALVAIATVVCCLLNPWVALVLVVPITLVGFYSRKPLSFKVALAVVYFATLMSFILTTLLKSNPEAHYYPVNSGLRGVVLRYAKRLLGHFLSADNASIVVAMLFGDKGGLSAAVREQFSVTGLAHLLAVSGLHIGLLVVIGTRLLKLCHIPKRAHLWILTPILIFYAYLCSWQYAVLRATIMYLVYAFARQHLHQADGLSALSLAATVILIIFPYALTSVSFLLSFSCLLGYNLFYQPIYRRFPVKSVAMYFSVTLGSLPFLTYFFQCLPVFGLAASVFLVPLLIFCFYAGLVAVTTFIGAPVLWVAEPVLNFVRYLCTAITELPFATITVVSTVPAIIVYLCGLIVASRFVFLPRKVKVPLGITLFTCYFLLIML